MSNNDKHCYYCPQTEDLRPYGPGGSWVCFPCGTSPEHNAESEANFSVLYLTAKVLSPVGVVVIGEDGGPSPLDPETLATIIEQNEVD